MTAKTLRRLIVLGLIALWEVLPRSGAIPDDAASELCNVSEVLVMTVLQCKSLPTCVSTITNRGVADVTSNSPECLNGLI